MCSHRHNPVYENCLLNTYPTNSSRPAATLVVGRSSGCSGVERCRPQTLRHHPHPHPPPQIELVVNHNDFVTSGEDGYTHHRCGTLHYAISLTVESICVFFANRRGNISAGNERNHGVSCVLDSGGECKGNDVSRDTSLARRYLASNQQR